MSGPVILNSTVQYSRLLYGFYYITTAWGTVSWSTWKVSSLYCIVDLQKCKVCTTVLGLYYWTEVSLH